MTTCKILDQGNEAVHFGASLGGGVYVVHDEDDNITICRHPAGDVQAAPDVVITRPQEDFDEAFAGAERIPEHRAVKEERERKAAEREAKKQAERAEQAAKEAEAAAAAKTEKDKK